MDTNSVFIFMAADNNLDLSGAKDIEEMLQSNLSPQVNVLIQFDHRKPMPWEAPASTQRLQVKAGQLVLRQDIGETNTGDPAVLNDFLQWGSDHFPARRKIIIIWNHGGGVKDVDIYRSIGGKFKNTLFCPQQQRSPLVRQVQQSAQIQGSLFKELPPPGMVLENLPDADLAQRAFRAPLAALSSASKEQYLDHIDRLVSIDDTSRDFLDNLELKSALALAEQKIDLIAFDACMMSMFEIVYQLKDRADIVIGSEEIEPAEGWPYKAILNYLSANQTVDNATLARNIVRLYGEHYREGSDTLTQAALRTDTFETCAASLDAFAALLYAARGNIRTALADILSVVQRFREGDYIDLYDFALLCKNNIKLFDIPDLAGNLLALLDQSIIASVVTGEANCHAHGLAIYFPQKPPKEEVLQMYRTLDFTVAHPNWLKLITAFHTPPILRR